MQGKQQQRLPITSTNSATDSKGVAFGLEGNQFIPVVASIILSIAFLASFLNAEGLRQVDPTLRVLMAFTPFFITLAYTFLFVHNKPPRYRDDVLDQWLTTGDFNFCSRKVLAHPLYENRLELRQRVTSYGANS